MVPYCQIDFCAKKSFNRSRDSNHRFKLLNLYTQEVCPLVILCYIEKEILLLFSYVLAYVYLVVYLFVYHLHVEKRICIHVGFEQKQKIGLTTCYL